MRYGLYQPEGYRGECDAALPQCVKDLARALNATQRKFAYDALKLGRKTLQALAAILIDFAVDIHNGVGMWEAYSRLTPVLLFEGLPSAFRLAQPSLSTTNSPNAFNASIPGFLGRSGSARCHASSTRRVAVSRA